MQCFGLQKDRSYTRFIKLVNYAIVTSFLDFQYAVNSKNTILSHLTLNKAFNPGDHFPQNYKYKLKMENENFKNKSNSTVRIKVWSKRNMSTKIVFTFYFQIHILINLQ